MESLEVIHKEKSFAVIIVVHPHKDILVSCGEDRVWKVVGLPRGNVLLTGLGHTDWLSDCCFHPSPISSTEFQNV
ncbi:hypothetical protein CB1_000739014 [Camelus ferus]|nr:hypothetical protein CB1_000739014 [Camelus ferus]